MNHYDILRAIKTGYAPDRYTALYARSMGGGAKEYERYISGTPPLILLNSVGKPLVSWNITGNTVQDGTPTPDNPVEVKGVGDYDAVTGKYKITVVSGDKTANIYLKSPLMADEVLDSTGKREVEWRKVALTGNERFVLNEAVVGTMMAFASFGNAAFPNYKRANGYCNHLKTTNSLTSDGIYYGSSVNFLFPRTSNINSLEAFVQWLKSEYDKGTPVTIWYQLATPTTETVDVPQIPTLKGNCTIDVDTEVQPTDMSVTYKSRR